jgi:hypothetical protein
MDLSPEVLQAGVNLAESMARNSAGAIRNKIRAARDSERHEEAVNGLEEIINELVSDKQELISIAKSYQSELVSQQLTAGDVQYIVGTLFPLVKHLMEVGSDEDSDEDAEKLEKLEALKPFLSVETVNVLQLLGFNFRRAIGEPLTALCESLITSRVNRSTELQLEQLKNQQALVSLALDEAAYHRFNALMGRG